VIRLLESELLRARSRRMLWMIAVGFAVAILIGVGVATIRSHPPSTEELAAAQQQYDLMNERCLNGKMGADEANLPNRFDTLEEFCSDQVRPEYFEPSSDELRLNGLIDILKGSSFFVIIIGLFLGASFGGADWHTGTMATLLTWEPRRLRVMLARAVVTAVVVFVLALAVQVLLAGAIWLGAALRGSTLLSDGFWRDVFETLLRVGTIAVAAAVIGLGLATIGRNTAAAVMVLFGYLALFEVLFRGLRPTIAGWLLITNMAVAVDAHQIEITRNTIITVAHASAVVAVWTVGVVALGALAFRTRDVT
jgi:ABC-2 type transport system permease protein